MSNLTIGISHIGITVPDVDKSVFFFEAIGFIKVGGSPDYPSVFVSDGNCMITIWQAKVSAPVAFDRHANIGLHHLAIKASSLEALDEIQKTVSEVPGVVIEFGVRPIEGTPLTQMMCYEPGGTRIEFTHHAS